MLDSGLPSTTYSYLGTSFSLTTQTLTSTGVSVALEPNSTYEISVTFTSTDNGDNLQFKLAYSGTFTQQGLFYDTTSGAVGQFSTASTYTPTSEDCVTVWGIVRTSTGGKLTLQARKNTLLSGDATHITAGAHMVARKL